MKITNRQAAEAQMALTTLLAMNLPVKTSLAIALLSAEIDKQVIAFAKVRDALIKNYQIKLSAGEKDGSVNFSTEKENSEEALQEFSDKVNELMGTEAEDIKTRVRLPDDVNVKPESIKPILPFLEM